MEANQKKTLGLLFLGVLLAALDISIIGPALPRIRETFDINERNISWVISSYVLLNLIGAPLMAKLSDSFSRKTVYALSILLFGIGSLVVALSGSFYSLLAGRAIQGLGAGGIFPVAVAVIGDIFPPEKRGKPLGLIGAVFGMAFIIGPILGGFLLQINWRWIFIVNIPLVLYLIVKALKVLPEKENDQKKPFDIPGLVLLILSVVSMSFGLNQIETGDIAGSILSMKVLPFLLFSLILLPILVFVEKSKEHPVIKLSLFRNKNISTSYLLAFGASFAETSIVFIPALAIYGFGVSASGASFMLLPLVFALTIGAPLSGRFLDKIGAGKVLLAGTSFVILGYSVLVFFTFSHFSYYLSITLLGFGLSSLVGAPLRYIILNESEEEDRSFAQALLTIFSNIGRVSSASIIGAIAASGVDKHTGYLNAFSFVLAVSVVLLLLSTRIKGKHGKPLQR